MFKARRILAALLVILLVISAFALLLTPVTNPKPDNSQTNIETTVVQSSEPYIITTVATEPTNSK